MIRMRLRLTSREAVWIGGLLLAGCIAVSAFVQLDPIWVWNSSIAFRILLVGTALALPIWLSLTSVSLRHDVLPATAGAVFASIYAVIVGLYPHEVLAEALMVGTFFLTRRRLWYPTYKVLRILFIFSVVPGMVYWLLFGVGIGHPELLVGTITGQDMINPAKALQGTFYYHYPGAAVLNYYIDSSNPVYRLSAVYSEPGVVGTISGLLLVAERFRLRNAGNVTLLIAGLMSFSLAFAVILTLYSVYHFRVRILSIMVVGFIVIWLIFGGGKSGTIKRITVERLSVTESNWAGYNRSTESLDTALSTWIVGDWKRVLFGDRDLETVDLGSSGLNILVKYGLIGAAGFAGILLLLFYPHLRSLESFFLLLLFCAVWWQRPHVLFLPYFIIITTALYRQGAWEGKSMQRCRRSQLERSHTLRFDTGKRES